jgi:hypothetical protein
VPLDVVDESVLHLKKALELLEAARSRPNDAAVADQALRLVSKDKVEGAVRLLGSATASSDLWRAESELAGVARSSNA